MTNIVTVGLPVVDNNQVRNNYDQISVMVGSRQFNSNKGNILSRTDVEMQINPGAKYRCINIVTVRAKDSQ